MAQQPYLSSSCVISEDLNPRRLILSGPPGHLEASLHTGKKESDVESEGVQEQLDKRDPEVKLPQVHAP